MDCSFINAIYKDKYNMEKEKIGKVTSIPKELEFEWKIQNFLLLPEDDGLYFSSPLFSFAGIQWYLNIYPNGSSDHNSIGYIDICLVRESSGSSIILEYSISLKTLQGETFSQVSYINAFEEGDCYGTECYISRSKLFDKKSIMLPSDVLTVICSIKDTDVHPDKANMEELYDDFKSLMDRENYSDTTIQVKGKNFKLHKNILAARNPFFDSMFKTDMRENITGIVSISDCEPEVFNSFIHFVYTGEADELSLENVCDLYEVADKYQQDQLKEECLQFMLNSISVDNFCDFVVVALKHDDKKLLERAIGYFAVKMKEIVFSMKWVGFLNEYPTYANEFHLQIIEAEKNSKNL